MKSEKTNIDEMKALIEELEAMNEEFHAANEELILTNQTLENTARSLKESEEKFRIIFHQAPLGILHFDEKGIITECNDIFVKIIGSSREALTGLNMFMLPDERVKEALSVAIKEQKSSFIEIEYKSFTADKTTPVRILFAPVTDDTSTIAAGGIGIIEDITERVESQKELQVSRERLQLAMDAADHAFWTLDLVKDKPYYTMLGYKPNEFPMNKKSWEKLFHPDDSKRVLKRILESVDKCETFEERFRMKCKDGSWKWISGRGGSFQRNNEGKPTMAAGVHEDITEKVKAEEALKESENRFRNLIDLAVDGIMTGSPEGVITRVNRRLTEITGIPENKIIGMHISELFPRDVLEKNPLRFDLLQQGSTVITGRKLIRPDSNEIFIEMHSKMMPDKTYQSIIRDVTERKQKEEELAKEKEQLAVTLESIGDAVITTDINCKIMIMNRVAEELTGWSHEKATGKHLYEVVKIIDRETGGPAPDSAANVRNKCLSSDLPENFIRVSKDGTERLVTESAAPIKDSTGDITGVVLVIKDITEKQRLMDSLQNSQKLESLGILAGGIAHDFNNLLGGILSNIDLARIKSCDNNISTYLEKAVNTIDRARGLTRQLLTFASGGDPVKKIFPLFPFIKDTVLFALSGSKVSCEFKIDENLWHCSIDKTQIEQVVDNIVINSVQAMPKGGTIVLEAVNLPSWKAHNSNTEKDFVKISISDTGTGIPKKIIKHIFDPFFTTKTKGQGLGLATSYSIISRHGGYLDVESKPGQGSTFHIYLPAAPDEQTSKSVIPPQDHCGEGNILIMDDDDSIRDILSAMLKHLGYTPVPARDGEEAIDIFYNYSRTGKTFKAVILDLTVPGGMGGDKAVIELGRINSTVPVFVSSGYSQDPVISRPEDFGFTASIVKPFQVKELAEMLHCNLKNK